MKAPLRWSRSSGLKDTNRWLPKVGEANNMCSDLGRRGSRKTSRQLGPIASARGDSVAQITSLTPPPPEPLKLPSGKVVSAASHGELYSELGRLGIVGFSHNNGRAVNEALYAAHLEHIAAAAGKEAVAAWLAANNKGV
jgi:hypothetical protein